MVVGIFLVLGTILFLIYKYFEEEVGSGKSGGIKAVAVVIGVIAFFAAVAYGTGSDKHEPGYDAIILAYLPFFALIGYGIYYNVKQDKYIKAGKEEAEREYIKICQYVPYLTSDQLKYHNALSLLPMSSDDWHRFYVERVKEMSIHLKSQGVLANDDDARLKMATDKIMPIADEAKAFSESEVDIYQCVRFYTKNDPYLIPLGCRPIPDQMVAVRADRFCKRFIEVIGYNFPIKLNVKDQNRKWM